MTHGIMEGNGAYNRHSALPAGGAALALPLLEKAVQSLELDGGEQPIVIADYGSSQGRNSLLPVRSAIRVLRRRIGTHRAVSVFHVDLPANDFSTLFAVLNTDQDRYVLDEPNVFPAAIGRSFYGSVLPPGSVHLGWSSYAAMWLSQIPTLIPGHFFPAHSAGTIRSEFDRQGAKDWEAFLSLRAKELRPGGRLVVVPQLLDHPVHPFVLQQLLHRRPGRLTGPPNRLVSLMLVPRYSRMAIGSRTSCCGVPWVRTWPSLMR